MFGSVNRHNGNRQNVNRHNGMLPLKPTRLDGLCDDVIAVGHRFVSHLEEAVKLDGPVSFLKTKIEKFLFA
jgi:hypothetical protein